MKLTLKLFLVVWLFSSIVFAGGDMNNGGRAGAQNCYTAEQPEPATENPTSTDSNQSTSDDSVLTFIREYLISLDEEAGILINF